MIGRSALSMVSTIWCGTRNCRSGIVSGSWGVGTKYVVVVPPWLLVAMVMFSSGTVVKSEF
jgi:hypothetical protein